MKWVNIKDRKPVFSGPYLVLVKVITDHSDNIRKKLQESWQVTWFLDDATISKKSISLQKRYEEQNGFLAVNVTHWMDEMEFPKDIIVQLDRHAASKQAAQINVE